MHKEPHTIHDSSEFIAHGMTAYEEMNVYSLCVFDYRIRIHNEFESKVNPTYIRYA